MMVGKKVFFFSEIHHLVVAILSVAFDGRSLLGLDPPGFVATAFERCALKGRPSTHQFEIHVG